MKDFSRKNLILPLLGTVLLMALPHNGFAAHPPSTQTIPQVLASKPEFSTLASAISLAGIEGAHIATNDTTLSSARAATLSSVIETDPKFSTLKAAIKVAKLEDAIANLSNATVFAPTNEAFRQLKIADFDDLLANPNKLKKVLLNHIIPQPLMIVDMKESAPFKSLGAYLLQLVTYTEYTFKGESIYYGIAPDCGDGTFTGFDTVGAPEITTADIALDNNVVVHVLDQTRVLGKNSSRSSRVNELQIIGLFCRE